MPPRPLSRAAAAVTTITRPQMMVTLSRCLQCFPYSTRKHNYDCFLVWPRQVCAPFMDYTSRARAMHIKQRRVFKNIRIRQP